MSISYQWKLDGVPIPGETNRIHTIALSDYGKTISCDVTKTNAMGATTSSSSNPITLPQPYPVKLSPPVIGGGIRVGDLLSVTDHGDMTGITPITNTYQWRRNGVNIQDAILSTYRLVSGDVGRNITCKVRSVNKYGWVEEISNTIVPTT